MDRLKKLIRETLCRIANSDFMQTPELDKEVHKKEFPDCWCTWCVPDNRLDACLEGNCKECGSGVFEIYATHEYCVYCGRERDTTPPVEEGFV